MVTQRLGLDGVLIISVTASSGTEMAGLRPTNQTGDGIELGDVILAVIGTATKSNKALLEALERRDVGETVELSIHRNGKRMKVPVTLQAVEGRARVMHR